MFSQNRPKSLLLVGPTRIGKTIWARSLGIHIYWNGMTDLSTFRADAKYIIFDDVPFEFFPNRKQWLGAQKEFTATDKYRRKTTLTWGKPCIYIVNPEDNPHNSPLWNPWFEQNVVTVYLRSRLY